MSQYLSSWFSVQFSSDWLLENTNLTGLVIITAFLIGPVLLWDWVISLIAHWLNPLIGYPSDPFITPGLYISQQIAPLGQNFQTCPPDNNLSSPLQDLPDKDYQLDHGGDGEG